MIDFLNDSSVLPCLSLRHRLCLAISWLVNQVSKPKRLKAVMKKIAILSATFSTLLFTQISQADTLAQWTFELNPPADLTDSASILGIAADVGTGTASALHASAATDWTTPAGNGSANSLSANTWAVGDYFQFSLSSVGYSGISVSFDQTGSNTGPKDYYLAYSTDGSSFTLFGNYSLVNGSWTSGAPTLLPTSYSFDLSSITALNDAASIYFRLVNATTVSISGGTVATGGTDRVDNFTVMAAPVPEPSAAALLGGFGLLGIFMAARRRK